MMMVLFRVYQSTDKDWMIISLQIGGYCESAVWLRGRGGGKQDLLDYLYW